MTADAERKRGRATDWNRIPDRSKDRSRLLTPRIWPALRMAALMFVPPFIRFCAPGKRKGCQQSHRYAEGNKSI